MNKIRHFLANLDIEKRFFAVVVICSIPYFITNIVAGLAKDEDIVLLIIYSHLLAVSIITLYFVWKQRHQGVLINIFIVLMVGAFIYYMPSTAGPSGGIGYVLQTLSVLTILLTRGRVRLIVTIVMCSIVITLFTNLLDFAGEIFYDRLLIDYVINLLFITIMLILFKRNLDKERRELIIRNRDFEEMDTKLKEQSDQLLVTNKEIQSIRDNLQERINERTKKLEEDNAKLLEYSFINAHLVRAPIANILGITQISDSDPKIEEIMESILELDEVVRKIAGVLK